MKNHTILNPKKKITPITKRKYNAMIAAITINIHFIYTFKLFEDF